MFALSSKYALTLYEMVQKRGNLRWKASERFTLEALRGIMGVPKGKLSSWSNLKLRAIDPAVAEVNALSDYMVEISPIKTGRAVTHVEMRWWRKDGDASGAADRALQFSKVGRRVKAEGRTEQVAVGQEARPRPGWLDSRGPACKRRHTRRLGYVTRAMISISSRANGAAGWRARSLRRIPTAPSWHSSAAMPKRTRFRKIANWQFPSCQHSWSLPAKDRLGQSSITQQGRG